MSKRRISAQANSRRSKSKTVFRRFTAADNASNLKRLKPYIREPGGIDLNRLEVADPELAGWYLYTRNHLKDLSQTELARLQKIGFFSPKERVWLEMYRKLLIFKEVMGHTRVPARWGKNKQLSSWVHGLRSPQRKIPDHLRLLLDSIGFEWKLRDKAPIKAWDEHYAALCVYREQFGNCEVPAKWSSDTALGHWVSFQRLNAELLSDEQTARLDAIGFNWDILGNRWNRHYEQLREFKSKYGHCRVPDRSSDYPGLGLWVANTRRRSDRLTKAQRAKLTRLGFSWHPDEDIWKEHFEAFGRFIKLNGHPLVPARRQFSGLQLGSWVVQQRQNFKNGKLAPERKALLDNASGELGFAWDVEKWTWEQRFAELIAFKQRFGHCRVPAKSWKPNPKLGNWLSMQRCKWEQLPESRRARLVESGVEQTVPHDLPEDVREYLKRHKDLPLRSLREAHNHT